jgi:hypothetical protein
MGRHVTSMTIDDVEHYSAEEKAQIIASYPAHEREARAKGIPTMGSGRVFPVAEELIRCDPFSIPDFWAQINGLDFGWDHPFAAVNLAWDRDADCLYVTRCFRQREAVPAMHCAAIVPWGRWIPCAWPHDGYQHDKGSGQQLADQYRTHGLNMMFEHATHPEGGFGTEAGVMNMLERMQSGRFKVFSTQGEWFEEFRLYHRLEGKIVKERDDLMSATRIGVMMSRFASTQHPIERRRDPYAKRKSSGSAWAA